MQTDVTVTTVFLCFQFIDERHPITSNSDWQVELLVLPRLRTDEEDIMPIGLLSFAFAQLTNKIRDGHDRLHLVRSDRQS